MHFGNQHNEVNSGTNANVEERTTTGERATATRAGCTSTSDPGAIVGDIDTTATTINHRQSNSYNNNSNNNQISGIYEDKLNVGERQNIAQSFDDILKRREQICEVVGGAGDKRDENTKGDSDPLQRSIQGESVVNGSCEDRLVADGASASDVVNENTLNLYPPSEEPNCSPAVSIRSIDSSIIDSDSESDAGADSEGPHNSCFIKKLGQQVTYAPNHPDIPHINEGLTVLSQSITPNSTAPPAKTSPLAALASLGDGLSAAHFLGPMSPVPAPQIGSIALSNSSDVTFGDKHFYEGPVTIQQFLIDRRDKWKQQTGGVNGKDNPTYEYERADDYGNVGHRTAAPLGQPKKFLLNRKTVVIAATIALLTIVTVVCLVATNIVNRKTIATNSGLDPCSNETLCFVTRDEWMARDPSDPLTPLELPVHRVIISHTASDTCEGTKVCAERVRVIQSFHIDSMFFGDIGYNFLVSSDGRVFEGRGWDDQGAHTKGFNRDSLGISFIGTFTTNKPTQAQLQAVQLLIERGVLLKKLVPDYRLYGARQLGATESPGDALYRIIKTWPHWSAKI